MFRYFHYKSLTFQVFFCVCALFTLLSAAPAPEPQLAIGAAAVLAAAGVKAAIIAGLSNYFIKCATNSLYCAVQYCVLCSVQYNSVYCFNCIVLCTVH